jgi:hypothetical protein
VIVRFADIGRTIGHHCLEAIIRFVILVELLVVINSININKTKESLNSDGQQFYQYQQIKRKCKQ